MATVLVAERWNNEAGEGGPEESHGSDGTDVGLGHAGHVELLDPVPDVVNRGVIDLIGGECSVIRANGGGIAGCGVLELEAVLSGGSETYTFVGGGLSE